MDEFTGTFVSGEGQFGVVVLHDDSFPVTVSVLIPLFSASLTPRKIISSHISTSCTSSAYGRTPKIDVV